MESQSAAIGKKCIGNSRKRFIPSNTADDM